MMIAAKQGVAISLIVHELCTNAAKYGALSAAGGRLRISWKRTCVDGASQLHLQWQESEGPEVQPPGRKGFGTRLIEHTCRYELEGEAVLLYDSEGLSCTMSFPVP
jgi:two-component sensor histidine kinase